MVMVIVTVLAVVVVSCSPQQQFVCNDGSVVNDPDACTPQNAPVKQVQRAVIEESPDIPQEVVDLFAQKSKVKSVSYIHHESADISKPSYRIAIKDRLMKISLPTQTDLLNKNTVDMVIIDGARKEAQGYCESLKYCIEQGNQGAVDYAAYYKKSPFDWVEEVQEAELLTDQRLFNRDTTKVLVNGEYTYWVDSFFGIPLKVEGNNEVYTYDTPLFNGVTSIEFEEKD